ncbi:MAG: histone deacetylase [Synergistetes bacterium]|nr:histone deacetylase [Synergistota bacterium]MCX8127744.1 histone deacetylase [Synergistota bacterium]MDW8191341.1 histone deacetylase [Synergistota bacterium]
MLKSQNRLALVFFPAFDWAITPTHPEREERLLYTWDQILEEGILDINGIEVYNPTIATEKDIQRVHFCIPDVRSRVPQPHLISAGGAIKAAELVLKGEADKAFAMVRPPGHHAQRVVWGDRGFCIINIEAVMIENIRQRFGHKRVAIVDTDCHHGDGTQDIYWNDRDTLYISIHQDGRTLYPGTGFPDELGGPAAIGYNINIPLPPGTGEEGFLYVLDNLILPILEEYKPDLVINSAGQDNHYTDPITNMNFTAQGYAKLTQKLNPDIAVLEGGYSIEGALPYVNVGIILALAGLNYSNVVEPDYNPEKLRQSSKTMDYIKRLCDKIYNIWRNREVIRDEMIKDQKYILRKRNVYYDTDGILEKQTQIFKICPDCSGVSTIESESDWGAKIFAVTIPRDACEKCFNEGYRLFEEIEKEKYYRVYLQDKVNDFFSSK